MLYVTSNQPFKKRHQAMNYLGRQFERIGFINDLVMWMTDNNSNNLISGRNYKAENVGQVSVVESGYNWNARNENENSYVLIWYIVIRQ